MVATPTQRYTAEEDTLHRESQQPGLYGKFVVQGKTGAKDATKQRQMLGQGFSPWVDDWNDDLP